MLHSVLRRQLRKIGLRDPSAPPDAQAWSLLLERVSRSYGDADSERYLLEHSMETLSKEMRELYDSLQRSSESQLAAERDKLQAVISSVGDGLAILGSDGQVVGLNPAGHRLLNVAPEEAVRWPVTRIFCDPDRRDAVAGAISSGTSLREDSGLLRRLDGTCFPASYVLNPVRQGAEQVGAVLVFHDISQRVAVEEELRRARSAAEASNQLKSAFLASMSHEIRTPMNAVLGLTDLLLDTSLTQEQREYATMVVKAGEHLLTLVNDVLDFSKIEAGHLDLDECEFEVHTLLDDVLELFAERAVSLGLELVCQPHPELPLRVRADPARIRQVLTNLVGNAMKFTSQGQIVVRVAPLPGGEQLRFEVEDTGIGISPEVSERLFQPFLQADSSTSRRFGGTGLGLAISKQLSERMGGEIGLRSAPGEGSCFWFTVAIGAEPSGPRLAEIGRELARRSALLVVSRATTRRSLAHLLRAWSLEVTAVDGAGAALDALRAAVSAERPFDVVLIDQELEGLDGLSLCGAMQVDPRTWETPRVLMAPFGQRLDAQAQARAGVRRCLSTPVRTGALCEALGEALGAELSGDASEANPREEEEEEAGGERPHLLVVEDNAVNQKLAERLLDRLGYTCELASSGHEALAAAARGGFDAVLMDIMMPEMDGYQTTRELRARERGRRIPIIAMTANALSGERDRCLEAGMDDYITKPVKRRLLHDTLRRWVTGRYTATPVLDLDALGVATGGDEDLMSEVLRGLEGELTERRRQLEDAASAGDHPAAVQATRALGAVCASVGAHALRAACQEFSDAQACADTLSAGIGGVLKACDALAAALTGRAA
jgi:two-component system sensor histidine kinase/response regulator